MTSEEKEVLNGLSQIEREMYLAKRQDKLQADLDAEKLEKLNLENKGILPEKIDEIETNIANDKTSFNMTPFVLTREILMRGVFRPNFHFIKNCFVRVKINQEYRICKIISIKKVQPYKLASMKRTNKRLNCNLALDLNIDGANKKMIGWPINNISSKPPSVEEFQVFKGMFEITEEYFEIILEKYKCVVREFKRPLTNDEITEVIKRKLETNPKKESITETKMKIIKARDAAIYRKDKFEAERLQRELEKIEDEEYVERMKDIYDKNKMEEMLNLRKEASNKMDDNSNFNDKNNN